MPVTPQLQRSFQFEMVGQSFFHTFACISGAAGVAAGAFGAHALKSRLTSYQLASWTTATQYQLLHSIALAFVATQPASQAVRVACWGFATGITFFSGSIYGLCLTSEGQSIRKLLGPITPLGGSAFIVGWIALAMSRGRGLRL